MAKKSPQKEKKFLNGNYQMLPILVVLCIIPFIMRLYIYDSGLEQFAWFPNRNQEVERQSLSQEACELQVSN